MIGLDNYRPADARHEREDPVVMLKALGFDVTPDKVEVIQQKWSGRECLRFFMRWHAWTGYSRAELNAKLGEAVQGKELLLMAGLNEHHEAMNAVEGRRRLLANVVEDLSLIYTFTLEQEIPFGRKEDPIEEIIQEVQQPTSLADLLRQAMAEQQE